MIQLSRKKKDSAVVGLEMEAGSVAAVEVPSGGSAPARMAIAPLPAGAIREGEVADGGAVATALRAMFSEHKLSRRVRIGISNQRVIVRTLRLPAVEDPQELEMAVRSQAQEQIPMPLEQAVLDHRVVGGVPSGESGSAQIDVVVVAARRDMIDAALATLDDADLEPVGIDLSAFALIRALGQPAVPDAGEAPADQPVEPVTTLYCNIGDVTNLAIAKGRSCLFTRVSPSGLETISRNLSEATGLSDDHSRLWLAHVGLAQEPGAIEGDAETIAASRRALEAGAETILDEVRLSLDFYGSQEGAAPVAEVVLGGPGGAIDGIAEWMAPTLGLPVSAGVPSELSGIEPKAASRLTVPYGLALDS